MHETHMYINAQSVKSRKGFHLTHGQKIFTKGEFAGVVARVESLRGRMSEAGRQVEGLFEALLSEAFNG